jgi:hypothetical protein
VKDLAILVPDRDIEQVMIGLLNRPQALGIRAVSYELVMHPNHDPGCYHTGSQLLGLYRRDCRHALVVFDRAWGGAPSADPAVLSRDVETVLSREWSTQGAG